jgi:diguanylate cyclase (GGDEF)-like protein
MAHLTEVLRLPSLEKKEVFLVITEDSEVSRFFQKRSLKATVISLLPEEQALLKTLLRVTKDKDALEKLTTIDPLTGLLNYGFFWEEVERSIHFALIVKKPSLFVVGELDNKENLSLPSILALIGKLFKEVLRKTDIIAHYGQGKFGIILNMTTPSEGLAIIKRLQEVINRKINVEISFGIVPCFTDSKYTKQHLLAQAEHALRLARESGTNSIYFLEYLSV